MARPKNNPYNCDELIEKRKLVFEIYRKNYIVINSINSNDIFNFGKHKGRYVKEIIEQNPEYIEWIIFNCKDKCFIFDDNFFQNESYITKQHIQLNSIKLEISRLQTIDSSVQDVNIPNYYSSLC